MKAKLFRVILQVTDIAKAEAFYSAVLGTPGKRVSPGRHYFDCGGTLLACLDPNADGDEFAARPNVDYFYIAVEDLEATFEKATAAGAALVEGDIHGSPAGAIHVRPWGERSFYVNDPFGNQLCFVDASTMFTG